MILGLFCLHTRSASVHHSAAIKLHFKRHVLTVTNGYEQEGLVHPRGGKPKVSSTHFEYLRVQKQF